MSPDERKAFFQKLRAERAGNAANGSAGAAGSAPAGQPGADPALAAQWCDLDAPRQVAGGRFLSRPGVFAWDRIDAGLKTAFRAHPGVREALAATAGAVGQGQLPPSTAARQLLALAGLGAAP